jgi:hypothetical protein
VFAGLWAYAHYRDASPDTIHTVWNEGGSTRTGNPFTAPVRPPPGFAEACAPDPESLAEVELDAAGDALP